MARGARREQRRRLFGVATVEVILREVDFGHADELRVANGAGRVECLDEKRTVSGESLLPDVQPAEHVERRGFAPFVGKSASVFEAILGQLLGSVFTIEGPADAAGFVNALPMLHSRWMPAIDGTGDALDELVVLRSRDVETGPAYSGSFDLRLHDAPGEELSSLTPVEPIAAYWRQVAATFVGGERV